MTKKNTYDYPPYLYLKKVLHKCPKAAIFYLLLWENKNDGYKLILKKNEVRDIYFLDYEHFVLILIQFSKLGILNFHEKDTEIIVSLKQNEDFDFKGYCPC